jgi:DNA polymerase
LGTIALAALTHKRMGIAATRGLDVRHGDAHLVATYHPSALLRAPDEDRRAELRDAVSEDLVRAVSLLRGQ